MGLKILLLFFPSFILLSKVKFQSILLLGIIACGGDSAGEGGPQVNKDYLSVPPSLELLSEGQTVDLKINSNCNWSITEDADWLTVTPMSGSNEQTVIEAGIYRLRYVTFFLFLNGILDVIVGSMRGMGYSTIPTAITMIGIVGIRLSYIFLVFAKTGTLQSLYLCFPISWLITSVIQLCLWHHIYTTQKT